MEQVERASLTDLNKVLVSLGDAPVQDKQGALMELLPELGNTYTGTASTIAAQFAQELADLQGVALPTAQTITDLPAEDWKGLVGWAGKTMAEQTANATFFGLLAGGLVRRMTEAAADTMVANFDGIRERSLRSTTRYARVPAAGCCAFCAMLATRGAEYRTAESAQYVGAAVGIYKTKTGTKAGQVRVRGARDVGQTFHDNCRCTVVPLTGDTALQVGEAAKEHRQLYEDAAAQVRDQLEVRHVGKRPGRKGEYATFDKTTGVEVSRAEQTNRIVNAMRRAM